MNMRIDGQRPAAADTDATRRLESGKPADRPSGPAAPAAAAGDRVEVSSDLQLVQAAVQAAQDAPSVRPEAVERGRRALDSGTLGADTARLADRMISSLLGE